MNKVQQNKQRKSHMRWFACLLLIAVFLPVNAFGGWSTLSPGLELGKFTSGKPSQLGDSQITIIRIDPKLWELMLIGNTSEGHTEELTAKDWSKKYDLTAAINAGMFKTDYLTHVGYLGTKDHVNCEQVNHYQSVAAFHPKKNHNTSKFRIFDLDDPLFNMQKILANYSSVVQNLRMIKRPAENRWKQQKKVWSEAALGEDKNGRVLFIFTRSPFSMHDLNNELIALKIGIVAAQHLEGGPEAQLFLHTENASLELFGSYETSFNENDNNNHAWPIPNVIGIRFKK